MVKAVSYNKNKARATNKKAKVAKKGRTMKKSRGMKKRGGMKKRTAVKKQRGGNADLVEKINDELRREMENGNISFALFQCLTMNNEAGKMVREKAAKWGNLTVSEWTTRVIMDNENCQIHLD